MTLLQELAGKNAEMTEEVARVRLDLNARIERLENDRRSKEDLYNRISTLEKEVSGQFARTQVLTCYYSSVQLTTSCHQKN